jgi:hypothetical protein
VNLKRQLLVDDLAIVNLWLTAWLAPSDPGDSRMVVRQKDGPKSTQCPPEGGRGQGHEQTRIRVGPKRIRVESGISLRWCGFGSDVMGGVLGAATRSGR